MWLMKLLYLPFGVIMGIVFWIVVFLLFVVHMLRHVIIGKESKTVFWLSTAFDLIITATTVVLFEGYYGDWSASNEVKLLVMVIAYAVADYLFTGMVFYISENVAQTKIESAVASRSRDLADTIVARRDQEAFQSALSQKLADEVEKKAAALVNSRDAEEFSRLRQEQLDELVQREFEKRLQAAIEAGARTEFVKRLENEVMKERKGDTELAVWVALQGSNKTVADAFGLESPPQNKVFAIPYWIYYDPTSGKPRITRQNSTTAHIVSIQQVSFVSNRWSKVEGTYQIVLDGAIINRPS